MGGDHRDPGALPRSRNGGIVRAFRVQHRRCAGMFQKDRREREMALEMESHLEMQIEENVRRGMSPAEARRAALIQAGGLESAREAYRDRRGLPWLETMLQDF